MSSFFGEKHGRDMKNHVERQFGGHDQNRFGSIFMVDRAVKEPKKTWMN
jgi:hypothetical protein